MSQAQLAGKLNRTQAAVSHWESGRRSPSLDDLIEIAHFLGQDVTEFLPPRRSAVPAALRAVAQRLDETGLLEDIERFLQAADAQSSPSAELSVNERIPRLAAEELIAAAGITSPPVDVYALARKCGARVIEEAFKEDLSGLMADLEDGPAIGIKREHPDTRKRFTAAHELAHMLLTHHERFHIDLEGRMEHGVSPLYDPQNEREANDFAANLLMPATWVRKRYKPKISVRNLATAFNVSLEAMNWRLINLRLR